MPSSIDPAAVVQRQLDAFNARDVDAMLFPEGPGRIRLLMIYEVQSGRIAKAWMIAGEKVLD